MYLLRNHLFKQIVRKNNIFTRIKGKLWDDAEDEKAIVPTHPQKQPLNVEQEINSFISLQQEISDMERMRMKTLDQKFGTNTHFHEAEPYEERLDSDHVMRRAAVAKNEFAVEKNLFISSIFNRDPQKKVQQPWIRDMKQFQEEALKQIPYPKHNKIYQEGDFFKYFEESHLELQEVAQFDFQEELYSQLLQLQMHKRQEIVRQRYESLNNYNQIPIVYEEYVYFSRDPKLGAEVYAIYQRKHQSSLNFNPDLTQEEESLILSGEMIALALEKDHYELSLDIREQRLSQLYLDFQPNKTHKYFGVLIPDQDNNHIFVQMDNNHHILLENVGSSFCFQGDYLYYIKRSDLDVDKSIVRMDLHSKQEQQILPIDIGQQAMINNIDESYSYITIDSNSYNLKGELIANSNKLDFNKQNMFIKLNNQLVTKEGTIIYKNEDKNNFEFSVHETFIAILKEDKITIIKEKGDHDVKIDEQQYSINQESQQIKNSSFYYFSLQCPNKPLQVLKYNVETKSVALHYQEYFPQFDYKQLIMEQFKISDNYTANLIYNQQNPINFIVIRLIDSMTVKSMENEDVIILENGGAICQIPLNYKNQQIILDSLPKFVKHFKSISDKLIISAQGGLSGLIGSHVYFQQLGFHALISYNGIYDDQIIEIDIKSYDSHKVPTLRNTLFLYDINSEYAYQSKKMVALLRENKHNEVAIQQEIGVNIISVTDQLEEQITRLTYILSVVQ